MFLTVSDSSRKDLSRNVQVLASLFGHEGNFRSQILVYGGGALLLYASDPMWPKRSAWAFYEHYRTHSLFPEHHFLLGSIGSIGSTFL